MKLRPTLLVAAAGLTLAGLWMYRHQALAPARPGVSGPAEQTPAQRPPVAARVPAVEPAPATPAPGLTASVSAEVKRIGAADQEAEAARWQAVRALGNRLNGAELAALYDYLRSHEAETNGPMRGVIKNEVILKLQAQQPPPAGLAGVLLGIFADPEQDAVIRDYALQHLVTDYEQAPDKAAIQQALWQAVDETNSSLGGTALLGLHRLAAQEPRIDGSRVGQAALAMVQDESRGPLVRVTALQVCAQREMAGALPLIPGLINSAASTLPLRLSAIAALGSLGNADARPLLQQLQSEASPPLQTAVAAALRKLNDRLQR